MSGRIVIERPSGGRPDAARQGAAFWFTGNGYELVSASSDETHLVSTSALDRHRLVLRADAQRLSFAFEPMAGGTLPAVEELERRVAAATRAPGVPKTLPSRCPMCASLIPADATACPLCGYA